MTDKIEKKWNKKIKKLLKELYKIDKKIKKKNSIYFSGIGRMEMKNTVENLIAIYEQQLEEPRADAFECVKE